jgi:membrane-bound lytic murein transglycosylase A
MATPSSVVHYLDSINHWSRSCVQLESKGSKTWHDHTLLRKRWQKVCLKWIEEKNKTELTARIFFETNFSKHYQIGQDVLITGYYAPIIHACWQKQPSCEVPILGLPKNENLQKLGRQEINQLGPTGFPILAWTNRIDRFFLQIQGSGELIFNSGDHLRLGYAGKNHLPYTSIGNYLLDNQLINREQLSMPGIRNYLEKHPKQQQSIFEQDAAFVFFKPQKNHLVIGNLGVELKSRLSAAVDNQWIPLGSIIAVTTTDPFDHKPWNLLLTAEDTGGAIHGKNHIDIYMGQGVQAGLWAGNMKQTGEITYYLPK